MEDFLVKKYTLFLCYLLHTNICAMHTHTSTHLFSTYDTGQNKLMLTLFQLAISQLRIIVIQFCLLWKQKKINLSFGLRMNTMSSAYRTHADVSLYPLPGVLCKSSIPFRLILARRGEITPPWDVPSSGNSGLIPAFRQRHSPFLMVWGCLFRWWEQLLAAVDGI